MQPHPREACWVSACRRFAAKGIGNGVYEKCLTGWGGVGGENRGRRTGERRTGELGKPLAIRRSLSPGAWLVFYFCARGHLAIIKTF